MLRHLHIGRRRRTPSTRPTGNAGWKGSRETGVIDRPIGGRPGRRIVRSHLAPKRGRAGSACDDDREPARSLLRRRSACATLCDVPSTPPERAPLPEDAWSLPAPGAAWDAALADGLAALSLD